MSDLPVPVEVSWRVWATGYPAKVDGADLTTIEVAALHMGLQGPSGNVHPQMSVLVQRATEAAQQAEQAAQAAQQASAWGPAAFENLQPGDVPVYSGSTWVNDPKQHLTDGGNF